MGIGEEGTGVSGEGGWIVGIHDRGVSLGLY